jgi:hypothetical protein
MAFDLHSYMLNCAVRLDDVRHSQDQPRFFRVSGIGHLDEMLSSLSEIQFPAILIQDNVDGSISDRSNSNNYLDIPYFVFFVIDHAEFGDYDSIQQIKMDCKAIGLKILSRMVRDKRDMKHGLTFLNFQNIDYQTVGPLGDNCYGVMFSFTVADVANLVYNASDWITPS